MHLEDLVDDTLEEFLLECVGDKVEEVSQLPAMLDGINYLEDKDELIAETDACEILDIEDSIAQHCYEEDGKIHIFYSLEYILQTFSDSEFIWRIQGTIKAHLTIPDEKAVNWSEFEDGCFEDLYEKYKHLVHFERIDYAFIEADIIE